MKSGEERALRRIFARQRCSACQRSYAPDSFTAISRKGNVWVVSLRCGAWRACGVYILELQRGAGRLGDLTQPERERLRDAPAVAYDDVLDTHQFLEEFDGDFRALFGQPS